MLLAGTAISVYEYLESARPPVRHAEPAVPDPAERGPVHAADPRLTTPLAAAFRSAERLRAQPGPCTEQRHFEAGPAARPACEPTHSPPSVRDPSEERTGS